MERLYREVRAFRLFDGSTEVQKLIIAMARLTIVLRYGPTDRVSEAGRSALGASDERGVALGG